MGASFGDLDNDGGLDLYLGTGDSTYQALLPNRMFRNDEGRVFQDVTTAGDFGHLQKGHGVAFADFRGSGFEDVFEEMGGAQPGDIYESALYRKSGEWESLRDVDAGGGKEQPSRVWGEGGDHDTRTGVAGVRHIFRTVGFGSSFGGNPFRQHIGIGQATVVEEVKVNWPSSGVVDRYRKVAVDKSYRLREGESGLEVLAVR